MSSPAASAPALSDAELAAQRAAKKASDNKKKRLRQKARAKERAAAGPIPGVDPAVAALESSFSSLHAHEFFKGNTKLAYNAVQGRYVVAARDLPAGTLVLNQAPFAGVLLDPYVKMFCHHCFGALSVREVYQCSDCAYSRYCSKSCFMNASQVHRLECESLRDFHLVGLQGESASLRCILRALLVGHKEMKYAEDKAKPISKRSRDLLAWRPQPGCCFAEVDALMTHESNFPPAIVGQAEQVMVSLRKVVPENVWADMGGPRRAAGLYLRWHVNAHSITDAHNNPIGIGMFSAASYVNHSCAPTCVFTFGGAGGAGGCNMTIRTVRPLKAGEEITYNYVDMYAPSWVRRGQLKGRYFFDPCAGEGRHEEQLQAAEDKAMGGLKCLRCGKGQLNYPELARARLGKQKRNPLLDAAAAAVGAGNDDADKDDDKDDDATPESGSSAGLGLGLGPEVATEELTVTDSTRTQCSSCGDSSVTVGACNALLESAQQRLDFALGLVREGKDAEARAIIESDVIGLTTLPTFTPSSPDDVIVSAPSSANGAPSRTVAGLVPFHHIALNGYIALTQLSRGARDYKSVGKWASLTGMALKQAKMSEYPTAADALLAAADADAIMGGVAEVIVIEGRAEPALVAACTGASARSAETEKKRKGALEKYRAVGAIYRTCFGENSPITAAVGRKIKAMEKVLAAWA